jgi:hypothetical protein
MAALPQMVRVDGRRELLTLQYKLLFRALERFSSLLHASFAFNNTTNIEMFLSRDGIGDHKTVLDNTSGSILDVNVGVELMGSFIESISPETLSHVRKLSFRPERFMTQPSL